MHSTTQAINSSIRALNGGVSHSLLTAALVSDGFEPSKAATIIRWAKQFLKLNQGA